MTFVYPNGDQSIEIYPRSEHAYQAAKTANWKEREVFRQADMEPGVAKQLGRHVTLRKGWDTLRVGVMSVVLDAKFQDPKLRTMLLDTGGKMLIEGNYWHDLFFGICFCPKHQGEGLNNLGKLLMNTRRQFQMQEHNGYTLPYMHHKIILSSGE